MNGNFGFSSPWRDRLFGSNRAQLRAGRERLVPGLIRNLGVEWQRTPFVDDTAAPPAHPPPGGGG